MAADNDAKPKLRFSDDDLLGFVREERRNSIGFGEGDTGQLTEARIKALAYAKGEMTDIPSLENRSKAADTTIADAVETVLPDVMEVFIGGDDVATFIPQGEDDEEAAKEESDYINHVVFVENEGFLNLYTAMKDALIVKTGLFHWYPESYEDEQTVATVPAEAVDGVQAVAQAQGMELEPEEQDDGTVALKQTPKRLKVCIKAVPPEDFSVAPDTVSLRDTTYCVLRDRPRVQDLIARGVDPEVARNLKSYTLRNEQIEWERDEAGEHQKTLDNSSNDLRVVEVRAHYLRLDADGDGDLEIWRIVTDAEETTLIEKEEVGQIPFAALTPYLVPHRFYGESVADKLIQVQQIKTVLLRAALDDAYFALNQRMEVSMDQANEFTIPDLLRNQPGMPVRSKTGEAVRPLSAGGLNFDPWAALEYASTMAESRSGIVRNAQGLNPDTLHDTAKGAMALITAAQKRVRMIARVFAETGLKDLFLGVHQMLRAAYAEEGYDRPQARLGTAWKRIDPSSWPERDAMAIHVGVGSAGKDHDLMVATQRLELSEKLLQLPGAQGTLIDGKNVHQQLLAWERASGSKDPDQFWTDPQSPQAQQAAQQQAQQPSPEMAKAQADIQLKQSQAQADMQLRQTQAAADLKLRQSQAQTDAQTDMTRVQNEHHLKMTQMQAEFELKRYQLDRELELERERLAAELQIKREAAMASAHTAHQVGMAKVEASRVDQVEPGGEPG